MSNCFITLEASQDLDMISEYFVSRNIETGERLLKLFNEKCMKLIQFPNMGRSYAYIRPWLRGVLLDNYIIFYEVITDGVAILRVVDGRQNLETVFDSNE
jgi:toxin ParE1/3/4